MDALSDVLRTIRLEGALFLNAEFHEPWCVDAPSGERLASVLQPGAQHLAICHFVLEGRCWVQLHGGEPVALAAGDVVTLPHGDAHLVGSSGTPHTPVCIDHAVQLRMPGLERFRYGGDGDRTVIVCGFFSYEREMPNPLIAALPRLFCASVGKRPSGPWIEQSIRYAVGEAASGQPGSGVVAAKVAESLFVEALRAYIDSVPASETGWLVALRDPQVGRALALMHEKPVHNWSVAELAHEVHMSRSVLAERFAELVGTPPMQYLKRWRLAIAARRLRQEAGTLNAIAEGIGYESEAAFNRAFKGEYGVSPGLWRRGSAAAKV